ncbi:hypothetical protein L596_015904 [Steinernema carpocapsae]|uniref:Serpentine receptor class gamma n=1 Tax=Steinernema carpocapsae TaxID=34508 RepID=A0A4U5NHE2_STECR|nr:hypothetical protein L596_015904 [Steinernema carpocapsae]
MYRYLDGVLYVLIALVTLPVYVAIIKQFLTHKAFKSKSSFQIMAALGVFECLLQFGFIIFGIFTLCGCVLDPTLEKVITSLVNASGNVAFPTILLLSLNRFAVISQLKIFGSKFYRFCFALIFTYWTAFFLICLTPWAGQFYLLQNGSAGYDNKLSFSQTLNRVEYYVNHTCVSATLGLYLLTVIVLVYRRRRLSLNHSAVVIFIGCSVDLMLTYYGAQLFTWSYLQGLIVMEAFQITFGIMNPIIHLAMNEELRNYFFIRRKSAKVTVMSISELIPNGIVSK